MELSKLLIYDGTIPTALIIWSLYIACVIGMIVTYFTRVKFGKLIYALLEKGACSPETALTLEEADIKCGFFIKFGLKNHLNYKDLLVAITSDGKYYANARLTDEAPAFKTLTAITRKRRSRITESKNDTASEDESASLTVSEKINNEPAVSENTVNEADSVSASVFASENEYGIAYRPQRPTFTVETAKYYIPSELHAKVRSIYNDKSVKLRWLFLLIIGSALVTYFATFIVDGLIDMMENVSKK